MKNEYDVVIIGAGPAGAACARTLSENGVSNLLIEKKKFPRIKSCCGLLTKRAVSIVERIFGRIPEDILCNNREVEFQWSSTGRNFNKVKGYDLFLNIFRDKFDPWLVENSNTEFIDNCTCESFNQLGDNVTVNTIMNGKEHSIKCKYLVCATGANSKLRKIADKSYLSKSAGACIQKVYRGQFDCDKSIYYVNINKKYTDEAFSFFYFKNDLTYIGTGWTGKYNGYFEKWFDFLKERYNPELELIRDERCCIEHSLGSNRPFYGKDNVLFAGEAAGLIENWGIGITSALISGEKAAISILQNKSDLVTTYISNITSELEFLRKK